MKEIVGVMIEKIDNSSGIILGPDQKEYFFSSLDILDDTKIEVGIKVVFKEECYATNKENIYRAILISKYEEEPI